MFYEALGQLLAAASDKLGDAAPDEKAARGQRGIKVLLRRLGAVWPQVFVALRDETVVLEATLERARAIATEQELAVAPEPSVEDPVARYAALQRELDRHVACLHDAADAGADWAEPALCELRRGLHEAAEVQGRLVDAMLEA